MPFHVVETVINGHYFKVIPSPATSSLKAYNEQEAHSPARSHAAYRRRCEVSSNPLHSLRTLLQHNVFLHEAKAKPLHLAWYSGKSYQGDEKYGGYTTL